jgi:ABC-type Fe3+-hydroxamate transport system substrate-binding protein
MTIKEKIGCLCFLINLGFRNCLHASHNRSNRAHCRNLRISRAIISLVPSQTELLHYLGLGDRVVGITKFCIHPGDWHKTKTRIGGTKILKHGVIDDLQPDLIIANKEENTREDVELLSSKYPVWVSDVNDLNSALQMIKQVGKIITNTKTKSLELAQNIEEQFNTLLPYRT